MAGRSLKNPREFKAVYSSKNKAFGKYFFVAWKKAKSMSMRLGLTVSSKVGNSVTRNRIKRVLREIVRANKKSFPAAEVVITARVGAGDISNEEVRKEISSLIKKVHA